VRRVNSRGVLMEPWTTIRVRFSGWPAPEVIGRDRRAGVGQGAGTPVAGVFGWYERRAKALTGPTTRLSFCLVAVVSAATLRGARKGRRASESNGRSGGRPVCASCPAGFTEAATPRLPCYRAVIGRLRLQRAGRVAPGDRPCYAILRLMQDTVFSRTCRRTPRAAARPLCDSLTCKQASRARIGTR
jgi:hypothetical protein